MISVSKKIVENFSDTSRLRQEPTQFLRRKIHDWQTAPKMR